MPLTCNEFGVYRSSSNPADRLRWLTAVRTALEQNGIGSTMREYQGGFGVVYKNDATASAGIAREITMVPFIIFLALLFTYSLMSRRVDNRS